MSGYSSKKTVSLFLMILLASPSVSNHILKVTLKKEVIRADRSSPAFSAVQDALILKDISLKIKKTDEIKINKKKISLTGIKVSSVQVRKPVLISLRGEKVDVPHFTKKFINKISLSSFTTAKIENETVEFKPTSLKEDMEKAVVNPETSMERRVLASGIILTKPAETKSLRDLEIKNANPVFLSSAPLGSENYAALKIFGKINLEGGDFLRSEKFNYYIERHLDGKVFESGVFSSAKDIYNIEVGSRKGFLSVDLRNEFGEVLAYGEVNLKEAGNSGELDIKIVPTEGLFTGKALDAESSKDGLEKPVIGTVENKVEGVEGVLETDDEGYFGEDLFTKGSSLISSTAHKSYWPILKIIESGKPLYPRLIKKEAVESLGSKLDKFGEKIDVLNLLVGQVTHMGLSKRGVSVEILGHEYYKPVYNSTLGTPDHSLKATSVNGGFLFFNLDDGGYLVQVKKDGKVLSQRWFVVKKGHVSGGQIEVTPNNKVSAIANTFPEKFQPKALLIKEVGRAIHSELFAGQEQEIQTITKPKLTAFTMNSGEDLDRHIYLMSSKSLIFNFKTISKKWLDSFLNYRKSNRNSSLGLAVGVIKNSDFKIVKESTTALSKESKIYYFDSNGDHIETGKAGGGFIITNVPSGFKTVSVSLRGRDKFLNKVILASAESVSLF